MKFLWQEPPIISSKHLLFSPDISSSKVFSDLVIKISTSCSLTFLALFWKDSGKSRKVKSHGFGGIYVHHLPVNSAGTLIWLDVHLVVVDVDFRNVHLKVIRQELDWLPDSANARTTRCLEYLLQGGQIGARSYKTKKEVNEDSVWQSPNYSDQRRHKASQNTKAEYRGSLFPLPNPAEGFPLLTHSQAYAFLEFCFCFETSLWLEKCLP